MRVCTLILASALMWAQAKYSPGDVSDGQRLFLANCALCHGPNGDSVPGVDLGHGKFRHGSSDQDLIGIIRNGIAGTAMPPHTFNDFQAGTVVAYLRFMAASATRGPSSPGNAARGKTIFEGKGGCTGCHRVQGKGSRLGPELTDIGSMRRSDELQQSILDPDAEILPQNRFFRVVTRDGTTVTGRLLNQDAFTVQLLDSKEQLRSFSKTALREYTFVEKSPMPSFKSRLSAQEISDVVRYLVSLKGIGKS